MFIYFDKNGTIKEIVNDLSIRKGSVNANRIYCYIEGEPEIDDIWAMCKMPDGTNTLEVSFINQTETMAIPYDAKRDLTYFKDFEQYKFYYIDIEAIQQGLWLCTIRIVQDNTIFALGELTFNVQQNVIKDDNNITQSQYDYLLLAYADRTLNEQTGSDLQETINNIIEEKVQDIAPLSVSGVTTSTTILAYTEDKGIWVGSDTGDWYYWNGTQYVDGGTFIVQRLLLATVDLSSGILVRDGNYYVVSDSDVADQIRAMVYRFRFTDEIFVGFDDLFEGTVELEPVYSVEGGSTKYYVYSCLAILDGQIEVLNMIFEDDGEDVKVSYYTAMTKTTLYNKFGTDGSYFGLVDGLGNTVSNQGRIKIPKINNKSIFQGNNAIAVDFTKNNDDYLTEIEITDIDGNTDTYSVFNGEDLSNDYVKKDDDTQDVVVNNITAKGKVRAELYNDTTVHTEMNYLGFRQNLGGQENYYYLPYNRSRSIAHNLIDYEILDKSINNAIQKLRWELGSHTLDVSNDNTVAYEKQVPNNAIGGQINKLGGMSYKSENLLNITNVASTTTNGVTYKVENGVITFSGVASENFNIALTINLSLSSGSYTHCQMQTFPNGLSSNLGVSGSAIDGSNQSLNYSRTFSVASDTTSTTMYFVFVSGTNVNGLTLRPMVVRGTTAPTTYQPYFAGIKDNKVDRINSWGANLLNLADVSSTTTNGITYSVSNGVISVSGTASATNYIDIPTNTIASGTYSALITVLMGQQVSSSEPSIYIRNSSNTYVDFFSPTRRTVTFTDSVGYIRISFTSGQNLNLKFNLSIVKGSTAPTSYLPYNANLVDTLYIPSDIQNLTGYGWGINDSCYNYIDFDRKVFVQKVARVDLGSLTWNYNSQYGENPAFYCSNVLGIKNVTQDQIFNGLCSLYLTTSRNDIYYNVVNKVVCLTGSDGLITIVDKDYTDATTFKTAMNGVYLYYELATPVETDLSTYANLDDTIDVEPLGTLVFDSNNDLPVPSDIDYLIEVAD